MAAQLNVQVEDARTNAAITITEYASTLTAILSPPDLEDVIGLLGKARAHLRDQVPLELEGTYRKEFVADPNWIIQPSPDGASKLVLVRHPGFGWLGFRITPDVAADLAKLLTT